MYWVSITMPRLSLVAINEGSSLDAVHRLLIVVASLLAEHRLGHTGFWSCGTWGLEHGLSS